MQDEVQWSFLQIRQHLWARGSGYRHIISGTTMKSTSVDSSFTWITCKHVQKMHLLTQVRRHGVQESEFSTFSLNESHNLGNLALILDQYIINLRNLQNSLSRTQINSMSLLRFNLPLLHIPLNLPLDTPRAEGAMAMQDPWEVQHLLLSQIHTALPSIQTLPSPPLVRLTPLYVSASISGESSLITGKVWWSCCLLSPALGSHSITEISILDWDFAVISLFLLLDCELTEGQNLVSLPFLPPVLCRACVTSNRSSEYVYHKMKSAWLLLISNFPLSQSLYQIFLICSFQQGFCLKRKSPEFQIALH